MSSNEFGKHLKAARENKKMTLEVLGTKVNLSKSYLSHIENGRREPPSPEILRKLAEALGISYEELMIKAGYWNYREDQEDRVLFEKIYQNRWDLNNRIFSLLKLIADDDGFFPDYLHKDIFKIFGGWLILDDGKKPAHDFNEWYQYDYLNKSEEDLYEGTIKETIDDFNRIYNYSTIKYAIIEYNGYNKDREDFLDELIELMNKHRLTFPNEIQELDHEPLAFASKYTTLNDLYAFLTRDAEITYKRHLIGDKQRTLIENFLDVLFQEED